MTRAHILRAGIIVVTVLVAVTVSMLLIAHRSKERSLSLHFERHGTIERYSTNLGFYVQDVAFFWITNSSDKTYYLAMTGGTNTHLPDTPIGIGRYKQQSIKESSYMVICEFSDQTPTDYWDLIQQASNCLTLGPHSAVRLRVALPPEGKKRKVAVLCIDLPPGLRPFWTNSFGSILLRVLPRSVAKQLMHRDPAVLRVWCDRELSHRGEGLAKR